MHTFRLFILIPFLSRPVRAEGTGCSLFYIIYFMIF